MTERKKEKKGSKKIEKRNRTLEREKEKKLKEEKLETRNRTKKDKNCNQCDFSSIKSINLKRHKRIHHGEVRNKCRLCDFSSNTNLKDHTMRKHTGEKPFKCYQCNYSCVTSGHLKSHMSRHTEERPFKCSKCEKSFKHNSVLERHRRIHLTTDWGIFGGIFVEGASISS